MRPFTKYLAAALTATAIVGSASAQLPTQLRSGFPTTPTLILPTGVRPVPTVSPLPSILPGGCVTPLPRPIPYPLPGPVPPPVIDIDYKVFYRVGPGYRWQFYGTAESGREARRAARYLESIGYQVELVEKFDRTPDR